MEIRIARSKTGPWGEGTFMMLLVALVTAGWVPAAGATSNGVEADFYTHMRGFSSIFSGATDPMLASRSPSGCVPRVDHHWVGSAISHIQLENLVTEAPAARAIVSASPPSSSDRVALLIAGLVGIGGMPVVWGWKTRRREAKPANGAAALTSLTRILILGTGAKALEVKNALAKSKCPVEIVGYYPSQTEDEERSIAPHLILSWDKSLTETARSMGVDEIVVAVMQRRGGVLPMRELLDCRLNGIRVRDLASHFEHWLGQIRLDSLKPGWMIFGDGFVRSYFRMSIKAFFDVIFSGILLILALPVMAVAAIAIFVESGFPLIYLQERVGLNGKPFNVIKFRSMRTDAEKDGKPRWAQAGDSRITRVGRVIRKLRIDELPQLFSVFAGHMSLVGPRPERAYFVDQLTREIPFYNVRHSIKPGVTGWAQVRYPYGASVEDSAEKLQYDLYYVKNHSLLLDLKILLGTISVVLLAKGA